MRVPDWGSFASYNLYYTSNNDCALNSTINLGYPAMHIQNFYSNYFMGISSYANTTDAMS